MLIFSKKYFFWTLVLFIVELSIALYIRDAFVRPYVGDYLVTIFIYCFVRTFFKIKIWKVCLAVLLFSYMVEVLQYFHIVNVLGLQNNIIMKTAIGYGFEWWDLLAYTLGIVTVLILEPQSNNFFRKSN
ncbi:DUF2809 domain-containing protein [Pedobacter glucosidilyticus]|uniref:ribosomal maturation YjgA family protein n=1 Tax=Pedobacter glucosidilyticus TaxID=1122941 RepID=UPI0026ED20B4|nr:DUF2809 domain-containing protein [Pedobacter glucosidilyticus]